MKKQISWYTNVAGAVLAAAILFSTQMVQGHINGYAIMQAFLAVIMGFTASDNQHAVDLFNKFKTNWRTTLIGLGGNVLAIVLPYLVSGAPVTWNIWMNAIGLALLGIFTNDDVVTKQIRAGQRNPVTMEVLRKAS